MQVVEFFSKECDFDSHAFIRKFTEMYPDEYGKLLETYKDVPTAHRVIGHYLLEHSAELQIEKAGTTNSPDIFLNDTPNALWRRL